MRRALVRIARIVALALVLFVVENVAHVWGGYGSFTYEQARWDGHQWIYSGRTITVCDWRCYVGLEPAPARPKTPATR